jgi:hypothetical protein
MEAVGLGCLWFARNREAIENDPENYFPGKHLEDIIEALEGVDNVSNVTIIGQGNVLTGMAGIGTLDDEEDERTLNLYPIYSGVTVGFDIFMPQRLQANPSYSPQITEMSDGCSGKPQFDS